MEITNFTGVLGKYTNPLAYIPLFYIPLPYIVPKPVTSYFTYLLQLIIYRVYVTICEHTLTMMFFVSKPDQPKRCNIKK